MLREERETVAEKSVRQSQCLCQLSCVVKVQGSYGKGIKNVYGNVKEGSHDIAVYIQPTK